jgi:ABC-2 type transport system ATP-binding protein
MIQSFPTSMPAQLDPLPVPVGARAAAEIVVEDATKVIDGVTVLDRVSFTVRPGSVTAFLGPNGAGKSTTLRTAIGGQSLRNYRQPLQVVGAHLTPDASHPRRTARGHLRVVAASNGLPRSSVQWALDLAGITGIADVPVGRMSLGMRQRLGLAAALIGDPAVVILDEPHNGLDAAAIRWLRVVLRSLAGAGRTILLSSHLMSEIELICDDIVIINGGRLLVATTLVEFVGGTAGEGRRVSLEERYLHLVGEL